MQLIDHQSTNAEYLVLACSLSQGYSNERYFVRQNVRIEQQYASLVTTIRSRIECVTSCSIRPWCMTASYSKIDGMCYVSSLETLHDRWNLPYPKYCQRISGWISASKINVPVVHIVWSSTRYMLSFEEAKQVCRHYQTEIVSPDDLLKARSIGFELCSCGWLADGTNGLVLQSPSGKCWSSFHTGVLVCNYNTANVYCKMPM